MLQDSFSGDIRAYGRTEAKCWQRVFVVVSVYVADSSIWRGGIMNLSVGGSESAVWGHALRD